MNSRSVFLGLAAAAFVVGCQMPQNKQQQSPPMEESSAAQPMLTSDPVAALRAHLPAGWSIMEVTANTYPWYRPEGLGTAVKLISPTHHGEKPQYDAAIFIMPADYEDGGEDPTKGQMPTTPPQLICQASNGKVYLWAYGAAGWSSIREDVCRALMQ